MVTKLGRGKIVTGKGERAPLGEAFARGERSKNLICGFDNYKNRWLCKVGKYELPRAEQVLIKSKGELEVLFRNPKFRDVQIIGVKGCKMDYGNLVCERMI